MADHRLILDSKQEHNRNFRVCRYASSGILGACIVPKRYTLKSRDPAMEKKRLSNMQREPEDGQKKPKVHTRRQSVLIAACRTTSARDAATSLDKTGKGQGSSWPESGSPDGEQGVKVARELTCQAKHFG